MTVPVKDVRDLIQAAMNAMSDPEVDSGQVGTGNAGIGRFAEHADVPARSLRRALNERTDMPLELADRLLRAADASVHQLDGVTIDDPACTFPSEDLLTVSAEWEFFTIIPG